MRRELESGAQKLAVVGMGYVGLPLAVAFAEKGVHVIGFDVNDEKISEYKKGNDPTNEIGAERLQRVTIDYTSDPKRLKEAGFIVVAVPTPVLPNNMPDLRPIEGASELIGAHMSKGSIVVYESTVYPGATEETCIPILEKASGYICGTDFKIGYSPERINPADKVHTLETIIKITSGMDEESAEHIANVYEMVIDAGVHRASSIKVAEAAKVIENSQRDINIAFVNELSLIFDRIGIDTHEVLEAAGTKWNFLKFNPGLVGGHCIGVDPYYLANKAQELGYHADVILSGRRINDGMAKYVAEKTVKKLIEAGNPVKGAKVLMMGLTFKENCPDLRNSKLADVHKELLEYGIDVYVTDPWATQEEASEEYGITLHNIETMRDIDAVIVGVGHNEYRSLSLDSFEKYFSANQKDKILIDIKGLYNRKEAEDKYLYFRL